MSEVRIDALLPAEMATRAEYIGVRKAEAPLLTTFILSVLAGAFIALGAIFATTVAAGATGVLPYGLTRVLSGVVFLGERPGWAELIALVLVLGALATVIRPRAR